MVSLVEVLNDTVRLDGVPCSRSTDARTGMGRNGNGLQSCCCTGGRQRHWIDGQIYPDCCSQASPCCMTSALSFWAHLGHTYSPSTGGARCCNTCTYRDRFCSPREYFIVDCKIDLAPVKRAHRSCLPPVARVVRDPSVPVK